MAGYPLGDSSFHRMDKNGQPKSSEGELDNYGARWYFSRKEIEENSPSRRDGIDLKKEAYFRKTYCTFLQDLGMRLKVPQVTIATAIVFCHRFFLRQSHAKSDRMTIATVCMFLAGKVEETPRPLRDVILISYEVIHKKDPSTVQRIKQKEVYEQQKELILLGERLVLATLGFDLNLLHPYKPLVEAIKKFKVAQNALAQVAWNFVNDGLRTSLFLQFKPHQIAAGAIFLAAKFLKVKLPSDGEKVWWQEFDVTPRQLEDVSNQMLELYEQNRAAQPSHGNEAESSSGAGTAGTAGSVNPPAASSAVCKNPAPLNAREAAQIPQNKPSGTQQANIDGNSVFPHEAQNYSNEHLTVDNKSTSWEHNKDGDGKDVQNYEAISGATSEKDNAVEAMTKIDKDKVKAALEKRRKLRNVSSKKNAVFDEDDLIERELENGIELASVDRMRKEERESWPKPLLRRLGQPPQQGRLKPRSFVMEDGKFDDIGREENTEEGELSSLDEHEFPFHKLQGNNGKVLSVKRRADEKGLPEYSERDLKRVRRET